MIENYDNLKNNHELIYTQLLRNKNILRFVLIVFKLKIFLDFVNLGSDWRHLHVNPLRQQSAKNSNDLYVLDLTAFNWHQWFCY